MTQPLTVDQRLVLTISDDSGKQVRRLDVDGRPGLRRVAWNLRGDALAPSNPAQQGAAGGRGGDPQAGFGRFGRGFQQPPLVAPGRYRATLGRMSGDQVTALGPAQTFRVVSVD